MGVMRCSKNGCGNIMCDTYVPNIGYVCSECQGDFIDYVISKDLDFSDESVIEEELAKFIKTEERLTQKMKNKVIYIRKLFDKYT